MATHYDILGVAKNASTDNINKAFRKLALKHHPNKGGNAEDFKRLSDAHDILEDSALRNAYNASLASAAEAPAPKTRNSPLSEEDEELLQHLNNTRHTVVPNTRNILRNLISQAESRGLTKHRRYKKAAEKLAKLSRRRTRRRR
jgi:curved DNA-binding protein CbpA